MNYSFWHAGILIGASPLDMSSPHAGQRGGVFLPTTRGLAVVSRLVGLLSSLHAFREECAASGVQADALDEDALFERMLCSPAGRKFLDAGRMTHELELRSPEGKPLAFESIAFSDPEENARLTHALDPMLPALPPEPPGDAPRFVVSVVLRVPLPTGRAAWFPGRGPRPFAH